MSNNIVSPEDVSTLTPYTITISPDDSCQNWGTSSRHDRVFTYVKGRLINQTSKDIEIRAVLEFSRTGRGHYHGTIIFDNTESIKNFFIYDIHQLLNWSRIEIDTIKDGKGSDKWDEYIHKQNWFPECNISLKLQKKDLIKSMIKECKTKSICDY